MNDATQREPEGGRPWLTRTEQLGAALLLAISIAAIAAYWVVEGGARGHLIEIDAAARRELRFQIDVNRADWPELMLLPGIGETLARRIVETRKQQGPFRSHEQLQRVRGIGPKTLERLRPYLLPIEEIP